MKAPFPKRPTQRDIANACGVSQMAVSLALRGSKKISKTVRLRILKLAKKLNCLRRTAITAHGVAGGRGRFGLASVFAALRLGLAAQCSGFRRQASVFSERHVQNLVLVALTRPTAW